MTLVRLSLEEQHRHGEGLCLNRPPKLRGDFCPNRAHPGSPWLYCDECDDDVAFDQPRVYARVAREALAGERR